MAASTDGFFSKTWQIIKNIFSAIGSFLASFFDVWDVSLDDFQHIHDDVLTCEANVKLELDKLKNFKFDPKWKTRVINVPIAIDQLHDFVDLLSKDFVSRLKEVEAPIHDLILLWKTEKQTLAVQTDQPSGLTKASTWLHEVQTTIGLIATAVHTASDLSQLFIDITDKIENAEPLFLQQGNTRQWKTVHSRVRIPR